MMSANLSLSQRYLKKIGFNRAFAPTLENLQALLTLHVQNIPFGNLAPFLTESLKKLTISAMLVAVAVVLSSFSIPIGPSRCFPIQHLCNVLAAVFLGPVYGVSMAFCTALIRNLLGTGSLLAFPGSMVGAFVSAMIFKYTRSKIGAYLGEVIGTGILGGMLCYPIASMMMGQKAALFTFVGPFLASTLCGTVIAAVIITALYKSKAVRLIENI